MTDTVIELALCTDCLSVLANGETPWDMDETQTAEYLADYDHNLSGLDYVSPGSSHKDCTHTDGEDCPYDEGFFSHSPCDACRRPLGGMRYPATAVLA